MTRDQAIARLVERDVARWGEGERAASLRLRSQLSYGLADDLTKLERAKVAREWWEDRALALARLSDTVERGWAAVTTKWSDRFYRRAERNVERWTRIVEELKRREEWLDERDQT